MLVSVQLDAPTAVGLTVQLNVADSATRGRDYALESAEIAVAANRASGFVEIDVYRDFEAEGDETITVALASVAGRARVRGPTSLTLSIVDGEAATVDKAPPPEVEPDLVLLPFFFGASGDAVVLVLAALNSSADGVPALLVAEWSTDIDFNSDIHTLGRVEVAPTEADPFDFLFGAVHEFRLPLERLAPNRSYFVRAYLGGEPPKALPGPEDGEPPQNVFLEGFSTDAQGQVKARCVAPARRPVAGSPDPLFPEQWHLVNTGQTGFSQQTGTVGADLRMSGAIGAGHNGAGVKLAVVDTGLEICHPDLAANASAGGSFNFAYPAAPGSSSDDPFNSSILGDHGTSVAGIAAAAGRTRSVSKWAASAPTPIRSRTCPTSSMWAPSTPTTSSRPTPAPGPACGWSAPAARTASSSRR